MTTDHTGGGHRSDQWRLEADLLGWLAAARPIAGRAIACRSLTSLFPPGPSPRPANVLAPTFGLAYVAVATVPRRLHIAPAVKSGASHGWSRPRELGPCGDQGTSVDANRRHDIQRPGAGRYEAILESKRQERSQAFCDLCGSQADTLLMAAQRDVELDQLAPFSAGVADQRNLPRADHRISPGLSTPIGPL
jgi:hypothetical protein